MVKFVIRNINVIRGRQQLAELVIDGKGQLTEFENGLESKYLSQFKTVLTLMEFVSNNRSMPQNKFKDITPKGEKVKEYEFKTKDLRVYAIDMLNGKVIILCGYKNQQDKDIRKFRSLKYLYLNQ